MMKLDYDGILTDADALIIVPPFAALRWPVLGAHLLQACAKEKGYRVKVFYANWALAAFLGLDIYERVSEIQQLGDVISSRIAFGGSSFYKNNEIIKHFQESLSGQKVETKDLVKIEIGLERWMNDVTSEILKYRYKIIGATTTFGSVIASISLLDQLKTKEPSITTIIGGAYCYGELAQGVASLSNKLDYVFCGDGEITFPQFIQDVTENRRPSQRIVLGEKCKLEENPVPDYNDYFEQSNRFSPDNSRELGIIYETSRGCWWGQKNPCTFCGLNCDYNYRFKSPEKVIGDLKYLTQKFPGYRIGMADCIIPYEYFKTLLPRIPQELPGVKFFYEVKANLTLEQVILLKKSGITRVQPGIESLSSALLKRMNKGCLARHNITLLRHCRSVGIEAFWNFLHHVPNEVLEDYQLMLSFIPLIHHLIPPNNISKVALLKQSEYLNHPNKYAISNIRPTSLYYEFLPAWVDIEKYAYYFHADYQYFSRENSLIKEVLDKTEEWQNAWKEKKGPPKLKLVQIPGEKYMLIDSRGLVNPLTQYISKKRAMVILFDWPMQAAYSVREDIQWALKQQLMIELDSWYISLVTAEPDLILEFKTRLTESQNNRTETVEQYQLA